MRCFSAHVGMLRLQSTSLPGTVRNAVKPGNKFEESRKFFTAILGTQPVPQDPGAMLEVPRRLVEDWKRENPDPNISDEAIAADIARVVAVKTALLIES
jgi:hypothetical protein